MNSDANSSSTAESKPEEAKKPRINFQDLPNTPGEIKAVRQAELDHILITSPIGTCVQVVDDGFKFLVIVNDFYNNPIWMQFDGKDLSTVKQLNRWFIDGQRLFKEHKPLDPDMLNTIRAVITSISMVCNFFEYNEKVVSTMMDNAIVKFAYLLYQQDFPDDKRTMEELRDVDAYMSRINMITIYISNFAKMMDDIRQAAGAAANDIARSPAPNQSPEKKG